MARRQAKRIPGLSSEGFERRELTSRIDFDVKSGNTWYPLELKYREGVSYSKYTDSRIQRDKYKAIMSEGGGFLWVFYEDAWFFWDLYTTKPSNDGQWTHNKNTVVASDKVTDDFVAFDYDDARYYFVK